MDAPIIIAQIAKEVPEEVIATNEKRKNTVVISQAKMHEIVQKHKKE